MKQLVYILFALMFFTSQTAHAQTPTIILQHDGKPILYEAGALQNAIDDATIGDTIYLSQGTFDVGTVNINKRVSIIGAGEETIVDTYHKDASYLPVVGFGYINVTFEENEESTEHPRILDALYCTGNIEVSGKINDFRIRKCRIGGTLTFSGTNARVNDGIIDRCIITCPYSEGIEGSNDIVKSMIVKNSMIGDVGRCPNFTFHNCNIYQLISYTYGNNNSQVEALFEGKLTNSIVYKTKTSALECPIKSNVIAINTLFGSSIKTGKGQLQNCYVDNTDGLLKYPGECIYSKETLLSKGYLGTDGTCVGVEGSDTPFTLVPNTPIVYDSKISVDKDSNKLNVTLKVKVE